MFEVLLQEEDLAAAQTSMENATTAVLQAAKECPAVMRHSRYDTPYEAMRSYIATELQESLPYKDVRIPGNVSVGRNKAIWERLQDSTKQCCPKVLELMASNLHHAQVWGAAVERGLASVPAGVPETVHAEWVVSKLCPRCAKGVPRAVTGDAEATGGSFFGGAGGLSNGQSDAVYL